MSILEDVGHLGGFERLRLKVVLCDALTARTGLQFAFMPLARITNVLIAQMVARGPDRRWA